MLGRGAGRVFPGVGLLFSTPSLIRVCTRKGCACPYRHGMKVQLEVVAEKPG